MPKLHEIDEYQIVRIHKLVGDAVKRGEVFLDASVEDGTERHVPFYLSGTIKEINIRVGDYAREDALLGIIDDGK
jgi:pyruvate/2-oxoglutarate dehydrogenase complex dihydrolipoamide acyltransferase (E2) component